MILLEHTDYMKTELNQTIVKSQGVIYEASFQHKLHRLLSNKTYNYSIICKRKEELGNEAKLITLNNKS